MWAVAAEEEEEEEEEKEAVEEAEELVETAGGATVSRRWQPVVVNVRSTIEAVATTGVGSADALVVGRSMLFV